MPAGSVVKASAPAHVADARADGKALFTGLYFGQGAVGEKLLKSDAFINPFRGKEAVEAGAAEVEKVAKVQSEDGTGVGKCAVTVNVVAFVNGRCAS
ncbi:hypothetical protein [Streptomyces sp. NPDC004629]|uniref:hypothetical protein n=1 Tax=Streptomyces sp. NPDC004629 TaxID=3364705 RepID=UPI003685B9D6